MIESDLTRDITSNYLTLSSENSKIPGYEVKMFAGKHITGFLDMTLRRVDEKNVFQYKILSYESVQSHFSKGAIGKKDLKILIAALLRINSVVNEFLLNVDCIVLNPEYVYMDGESYYFCYYPDNGTHFCEGLKGLMEYVLEHIDHDDRETVMTAYGLYQRILKNSYTLESLMEVFEEKERQPEVSEVYAETEPKLQMVCEAEAYQIMEPTDREQEGIWEKIKRVFVKRSKKTIDNGVEYGATMLLGANRLISLGSSEDILLTHYPFVLGSRTKNCDYTINNPLISRKHAVIWNDGGDFFVEDVGSTNGTYVNGERIPSCEKIRLVKGDKVEFANLKYRFE